MIVQLRENQRRISRLRAMENKMQIMVVLLCWLAVTSTVTAAPQVNGLFRDNMVLQREMPVPVWGTTEPGEVITVTFAGQTVFGTADKYGRWMVELAPLMASSEGREMTITGADIAESVTIRNVVVGEVWLLSGQSNMQWEIAQTKFYGLEKVTADYPLIRESQVSRETSYYPLSDLSALSRPWRACSPDTVGNFSAAGFFFGRRLHEELQVPIGLINATQGGTSIEVWMAPESFTGHPVLEKNEPIANEFNLRISEGRDRFLERLKERDAWGNDVRETIAAGRFPSREPDPTFRENVHQNQRPSSLFNSMIYPMVPYAFRGVLWYQGENNGGEDDTYVVKKKALIKGWRDLWGLGEFPFYFAQISSIDKPSDHPAGGGPFVPVRNAQLRSLVITNTGMAVTFDINETSDLHPQNKKDVGERLALWALAHDYGRDIEYSGPIYREHTVEGNRIRLFFDHVGSGLMVGKKEGENPTQEIVGGTLQHFGLAGADNQWHWADVVIEGDTLVVSSPAVPEPVAVRYAYAANPAKANLYNRAGLPASPFTTENRGK
jgi:sialate O-acetylesterase